MKSKNILNGFSATDILGPKNKNPPPKGRPNIPSLGFKQGLAVLKILFQYLTPRDGLLVGAGILCALLNGFISPISALVLGKVVNFLLLEIDLKDAKPTTYSLYEFDNSTTFVKTFYELFSLDTDYIVQGKIQNLSSNALYYVVIGCIGFITAFFQIFCLEVACDRMVSRLRKKFLAQVLRQDLEWFDKAEAGDLSTRLTDDLERVRDGFGAKIALLTQLSTNILAGFAMGLYLQWKFALVLAIATPILFLNSYLASSLTAQTTIVEQLKYSEAGGIASEVLTSVKTVAAFGAEKFAMGRYDKALNEGRKLTLNKYYGLAVSIGVSYGFLMIMYSIGLWYGSQLYLEHEINAGKMTSIFSCMIQTAFTAALFLPVLVDIGTALGSASTIIPTIQRIPIIDCYSNHGIKPDKLEGEIEFKGVSFAYPTRPQMHVLKGLDLLIPAGKIVALVGPSGGGKSTVVGLLMRFYDVLAGKISFDGVDISEINVKWLRRHVGIVSQEPVLFRASIAENIRYGREDASMADIIKAAKQANAHTFIKCLPQGYETEVGDRGTQLSGGQKQRIAIARALVKDPKILLLDEATSALDSESEAVVQAALDSAMLGRTTLIIAHRLSTVRNAHLICAMKDGMVAEMGTHEELMEEKGLYYDLVNLQNQLDNEYSHNEKEERNFNRLNSIYSTTSSVGSPSVYGDEIKKTGLRHHYLSLLRVKKTPWGRIFFGIGLFVLCGFAEPTLAIIYSNAMKVFLLKGSEFTAGITVWIISLGSLGLIVASFLFTGVMCCATATERLIQLIRVECFRNMLSQQSGWFDDEDNMPNKLTNTLARDPPLIKGIAGGKVGMLMKCTLNITLAVIISYVENWKLAFITLATFFIVMFSTYKSLRLQVRTFYKESELVQMGFKLATECIQNIKTVQQVCLQDLLINKYIRLVDNATKSAIKQAVYYGLAYTLSSALVIFLNSGLCQFGSMLLQDGSLDPFNLLILILVGSFTTPVLPLFAHFFNEFAKAVDPIRNISRLLNLKNDKFDTSLDSGSKPEITGKIVFNRVKFCYPTRRETIILRGINLTIEKGQTVALVGPSGCGKSTIISLLERFYSPDGGKICLDGFEIKNINLSHLRSQIGLVTQEPTLFDCSIKQNIAYGALGRPVSDEEIFEAAKMANIHDFISSLPKGYDTEVGDRGAQMSGGQKQRIAIARALIRNPKILLLDEATSALDNQSEKVVQEALEKAQEGRTCIIIAHRLSTVQNADKIVVICNGKVVEQGNHSQLLKLQGKYYDMIQSQNGSIEE